MIFHIIQNPCIIHELFLLNKTDKYFYEKEDMDHVNFSTLTNTVSIQTFLIETRVAFTDWNFYYSF